MGKKPVLCLVGLCLGLALTGCSGNGGGGWARGGSRKEKGPATARMQPRNEQGETEASTWNGRTRTVENRAPVDRAHDPNLLNNPHQYAADSYAPVAPGMHTGESKTMVGKPAPEGVDEKSFPLEHPEEHVNHVQPAAVKKTVPAESRETVIVPPPQPMSMGEMPAGKSVPAIETPKTELIPKKLPSVLEDPRGEVTPTPPPVKGAPAVMPNGPPEVTIPSAPAAGHEMPMLKSSSAPPALPVEGPAVSPAPETKAPVPPTPPAAEPHLELPAPPAPTPPSGK